MSNEAAYIPWGLHALPNWVHDELKRRGDEYGQNVSLDMGQYSGPRTAWVRFFSNGVSKFPEAAGMDGFVMGGVYDFNQSFGFTDDGFSAIGVDSRGNYHRIKNDTAVKNGQGNQSLKSNYPHRPPPSILSVSCELNGANTGFPNTCRKITVNWRCNSLGQLNYLTPYFLTPRITCLVEWGWNNYDTTSLVDLTDLEWMDKLFTDPSYTLKWVKQSNGNYDVGIGYIVDYNIRMNDAGGYDCSTTILNAGALIQGDQIHNSSVTIKNGDVEYVAKTLVEFMERDIKNIDSTDEKIVKKLNDLGITNTKGKVFKIDNQLNNTPGMWIRMDLVQDIINAFFMLVLNTGSVIKRFDISETRMSAHPFLKAIGNNVLVPNRFAPRFIFDDQTEKTANIDDSTYANLFKKNTEKIVEDYKLNDGKKFDDLKEAINPNSDGESFPVYRNEIVKDPEGNVAQSLNSGYWGFLRDLFINVDHLKDLAEKNDSLMKLIEQLLQDINQSLGNICQLRLIAAQYANSIYSVYDDNLPGISTNKAAQNLPKIRIGTVDSNTIKTVSFEIKTSVEMMNEVIQRSATPRLDPDGSTTSRNVKATPIISRYSDGDRLYYKADLATTTPSDKAPSKNPQTPDEIKQAEQIVLQQEKEEDDALKKKQLERSKQNFKKAIYSKKVANDKIVTYYLYEPEGEFMNYVLSIRDDKAFYQNNAAMPGTTLGIEMLGISGIDYLSQFVIEDAPETYCSSNVVWQVMDIRQNIGEKNWTTTIVAEPRQLTILL